MTALPVGWTMSTLDAVCIEMRNGISVKPTEQVGLPILRISAVRPMKLDVDEVRFLPKEMQGIASYSLIEGDLLFTRYNGNRDLVGVCAKVGHIKTNLVYPDKLIRVRIDPRLALPSYVEKAASAYQAREFIDQQLKTSAGQVGISGGDLKRLPIPIAPIAEQKRIADKLDTVLTRVDAVNTRLACVVPILKRFRQSVLAAASSGKLTNDWRAEHGAAEWTLRTIGSLCTSISDGPFGSNLKSGDYTESGARVVRLENVGHLYFDTSKETFISLEKYDTLKKHTLAAGDLLFSSFIDEEVRICEFPNDAVEPAINKADCFCIRVDGKQVNRRFLAYRLACKSTYEELKALVHGATRPRINLSQLRSFEVLLPAIEEQAEIVRRAESLFTLAGRLEARLQSAQTAAERMTPALLAKAFRGELVPQDPNDEPASELLRRLQADRPASKSTQGRRAAA